jgi:transposase
MIRVGLDTHLQMRGRRKKQVTLFSMATLETLVEKKLPGDHPLRKIRAKAEEVLRALSADLDALYSHRGRPSIPPEQIFLALLWMALFSIRSERLLEDCLRYDLRCRWFVGLPLEQDSWDHSTFSKARDALLLEKLARLFFERHLEFLREQQLLSSEHLSVDGSLLSAWASHKSLIERRDLDENGKPPPSPSGGRNGWVDFKGTKRSNDTHVSATDPEARLASKGTGAKLCHEIHVVAENRNNFAVAMTVTPPTGTSEREAAAALIAKECAAGRKPSTVGADRKYAEGDDLVVKLADLDVVPHFAVRDDRPNAFARIFHDDSGYSVSMMKRMRIEEIFAFTKTICGLAKVKVRGTTKVCGAALVALAAYNLTHEVRLSTS